MTFLSKIIERVIKVACECLIVPVKQHLNACFIGVISPGKSVIAHVVHTKNSVLLNLLYILLIHPHIQIGHKIVDKWSKGHGPAMVFVNNNLHIVPAARADIIRSQPGIVHFKKVSLSSRIKLWQILGNLVPDAKDNTYNSGIKVKEYVYAVIILVTDKLSMLLYRWGILQKIPTKLLFYYLRLVQRIKIY